MTASPPRNHRPAIPVLLLKTRSQPHDAYHDYFSTTLATARNPISSPQSSAAAAASFPSSTSILKPSEDGTPAIQFSPLFVPVLEHRPNAGNLGALQDLLRSGQLGQRYGGMIFTSQRAVEAWSDVVKGVEFTAHSSGISDPGAEDGSTRRADLRRQIRDEPTSEATPTHEPPRDPRSLIDDDFTFPLYSVGPATSRALNTLVSQCASPDTLTPAGPFSRLQPSVLGEHTGNGAKLAQYILSHYNGLQSRKLYTFFEAPRLPFTPLIGPPMGERLNSDDARLQKKPLLFLVGEQRRDIIPKTLMDKEGKLAPERRIDVDEVEVYATGIMESFKHDFHAQIDAFKQEGVLAGAVVVVVFSPQGCEAMLQSLGYIDDERNLTPKAKNRWADPPPPPTIPAVCSNAAAVVTDAVHVVVTIGPTTRNHLKDEFGFDADVCASEPTPQGVSDGLMAFLRQKALV